MQTVFVCFCFLVSGAAGLVYENVWLEQVGLVLGNTVTATTLVLAAFMGGLAIGSAVAGRFADRVARPLRVYGWLELGVAVAAFGFPWLLARVHELAAPRLELALLLGLLIVPTALMGATLPLLVRFARRASAGRTLGLLYAVNSAGAVLGTLVTGFYLIRTVGLFATSFLAQAANLAVGVAALLVDAAAAHPDVLDDDATPREPATAAPGAAYLLPCVLACGFAAMLHEVALMKLLPLVLGSSVYSFSLMTAAFITGIALGSAVAAALAPHVSGRVAAVGVAQGCVGLLFLATLPLINYLPVVYAVLRAGLGASFHAFQLVSLGLCFLVMLPPTLALGMVLPLAAEASDAGPVGAAVGRLYGVNTLGNILGTLLTGLVLVPWLGFKGAMELGVVLNLAAGCALIVAANPRGRLATWALGTAATAISLYVLAYPRLDYLALSAGVFRPVEAAPATSRESLRASRTLVFAREDAGAFVTVEDQGAPQVTRALRVNGKVDASNGGDMGTQRLIAHLPLLFHPAPRQVFVIGVGSGVTLGSALTHPVERVEAVELSPAVVQAARFFAKENHAALDDPRLKVAVDDGRIHLERSTAKYDVIISEPSNPWLAGITSLFSVECFEILRDHLATGGVVAQWVQTYELDPATFKLVLRTFRRVFPHVRAFTSMRSDVILLGSMEPLPVDFDRVHARMDPGPVAADLAEVGVTGPLHLFAHFLAEGDDLDTFMNTAGPVNTDDWPILEYTAPIGMFARQQADLPDWERRVHAPGSLFRRYRERYPPTAAQVAALAAHAAQEHAPEAAIQLLREALALDPTSLDARRRLADLLMRDHQRDSAWIVIEEAARRAPDDLAVQRMRLDIGLALDSAALSLAHPRRYPRALEAARECVRLAPQDDTLRRILSQLETAPRRHEREAR